MLNIQRIRGIAGRRHIYIIKIMLKFVTPVMLISVLQIEKMDFYSIVPLQPLER